MAKPVGIMVITDGRGDCLSEALSSLEERWPKDCPVGDRVIVCDTPNAKYRNWIKDSWPGFRLITSNFKLGFHGAIQAGWNSLHKNQIQYVFHLEDDFVIHELPVVGMQDVLESGGNYAQVALKRQPWSPEEVSAGGIVEMWPDTYEDRCVRGHDITVHRNFFTTNPSLYKASLASRRWPQVAGSEYEFTKGLLSDGFEFAYWGKRFDPPRVTHIGGQRVGIGY